VHISAAQFDGSSNPAFLCVRVTAEHTTAMAPGRLGHQSVGFSNIHTKSKMVCSRLTQDSCQPPATRWQV
jgi:hypothetical protein